MFTDIHIELVGPICNCEVKNLEWELAIWEIKDNKGGEMKEVGLYRSMILHRRNLT